MWRHYYQGSDAVIFVVDSNDRSRIQEAATQLRKVFSDDLLRDADLLVLANKQDLPGAMNVSELVDKLGLPQMTGRRWHVQATCASSGDGLYEGFDWLASTLRNKKVQS